MTEVNITLKDRAGANDGEPIGACVEIEESGLGVCFTAQNREQGLRRCYDEAFTVLVTPFAPSTVREA